MIETADEKRLRLNGNALRWRANNRERHLSAKKEWRIKNKEKIAKQSKEWQENNKERMKQLKRDSYYRCLDIYKKYRVDNREKMNTWRRKDYNKNKEKILAVHKKYRENNPHITKNAHENYRVKNRAGLILTIAKKSARIKGIDFNLTKEWIKSRLDAGICELSGITFDMIGRRSPNSPSIDRIDPNGGYTVDNCRIVTWSINRAFYNLGEEYFLDIFEKILRKRKPKIFT